MLAEKGLMKGFHATMGRADAIVLCVSEEYAASVTAMGELHHTVLCLGKPAVIALVGSGSGRWEEGHVGELIRGIPCVDFRRCQSLGDMKVLVFVRIAV